MERIKAAEDYIEKQITAIQDRSRIVYEKVESWYEGLGWIIFIFAFMLIALASAFLSNFVEGNNLALIAVYSLGLMVLTPILAFLIWFPLLLIQLILDFVVSILEGNDRLRGILVFLGIMFYVFGNLLQIVATY